MRKKQKRFTGTDLARILRAIQSRDEVSNALRVFGYHYIPDFKAWFKSELDTITRAFSLPEILLELVGEYIDNFFDAVSEYFDRKFEYLITQEPLSDEASAAIFAIFPRVPILGVLELAEFIEGAAGRLFDDDDTEDDDEIDKDQLISDLESEIESLREEMGLLVEDIAYLEAELNSLPLDTIKKHCKSGTANINVVLSWIAKDKKKNSYEANDWLRSMWAGQTSACNAANLFFSKIHSLI